MKIKSAATLAGLTPRAVRVYIDAGLVFPETYQNNGRNFVEFSDGDVERLKLIAALRDAMFSIPQIKDMLDAPERTGEIFELYRSELSKSFGELSGLVARVSAIDASRLDSPEGLCRVISPAERIEVARLDVPYNAKPGTCDDGIKSDERRLAYEQWQKNQARRDKYSFLTDWIYKLDTVHAVLIACLPILLFGIFVAHSVILDLHTETPISLNVTGYEILPGDRSYAEERTITLEGTFYRMIFRRDHFIGKLRVSGYEPTAGTREYDLERADIYIRTEDLSPTSMNISANSHSLNDGMSVSYRNSLEKKSFSTVILSDTLDTLIARVFGSGQREYLIVAPADSPEEAAMLAARLCPRDDTGDMYADILRRNERRINK